MGGGYASPRWAASNASPDVAGAVALEAGEPLRRRTRVTRAMRCCKRTPGRLCDTEP